MEHLQHVADLEHEERARHAHLEQGGLAAVAQTLALDNTTHPQCPQRPVNNQHQSQQYQQNSARDSSENTQTIGAHSQAVPTSSQLQNDDEPDINDVACDEHRIKNHASSTNISAVTASGRYTQTPHPIPPQTQISTSIVGSETGKKASNSISPNLCFVTTT